MRNAAILHSKIGSYYFAKGNLPEAMKYSARGFEEAEKKEEAMVQEALRFAEEIDHLPSIANAEGALSGILFHKGDERNGIEHAKKA